MLLSKEKNPKMEEVRRFIPVSSSSDFDSLLPHIGNAERDYLLPVIGQATYNRLQTLYDQNSESYTGDITPDSTSGDTVGNTEDLGKLLLLVQSAVIHLAYWIGYDLLNAHITDGGFKRTESETVKGLFKYQEENLKKYFRTNGFNGLDCVLLFLELNISSFEEFKSSEQYTVIQSSFIPNTDVFNRIVFISNSRLTFLRMKPHMLLIEETEILQVMGQISLAELKDEMLKEDPSPQKMAILPYIQKAMAFLASALLMEESGADLLDNGLYFTSNIAISTNDTQIKPTDPKRIEILVKRNRNFGNAYLDQIRSFLVAHAADWTDVAPSTGKVLRRDNKDKKTFWA